MKNRLAQLDPRGIQTVKHVLMDCGLQMIEWMQNDGGVADAFDHIITNSKLKFEIRAFKQHGNSFGPDKLARLALYKLCSEKPFFNDLTGPVFLSSCLYHRIKSLTLTKH